MSSGVDTTPRKPFSKNERIYRCISIGFVTSQDEMLWIYARILDNQVHSVCSLHVFDLCLSAGRGWNIHNRIENSKTFSSQNHFGTSFTLLYVEDSLIGANDATVRADSTLKTHAICIICLYFYVTIPRCRINLSVKTAQRFRCANPRHAALMYRYTVALLLFAELFKNLSCNRSGVVITQRNQKYSNLSLWRNCVNLPMRCL